MLVKTCVKSTTSHKQTPMKILTSTIKQREHHCCKSILGSKQSAPFYNCPLPCIMPACQIPSRRAINIHLTKILNAVLCSDFV